MSNSSKISVGDWIGKAHQKLPNISTTSLTNQFPILFNNWKDSGHRSYPLSLKQPQKLRYMKLTLLQNMFSEVILEHTKILQQIDESIKRSYFQFIQKRNWKMIKISNILHLGRTIII